MSACSVVDQFCLAPANLLPLRHARGKCFACGLSVCAMCSSIRSYYNYGKVRLCNNCQCEYDGSENIVLGRMFKMAGY